MGHAHTFVLGMRGEVGHVSDKHDTMVAQDVHGPAQLHQIVAIVGSRHIWVVYNPAKVVMGE